jgi:hypothetical protein
MLIGRSFFVQAVICALILIPRSPSLAKDAEDCVLPPEEKAALLALDPDAFDQGLEPLDGWRPLSERGCYSEAARLIRDYRALHDIKIDHEYGGILFWHEGQLWALDGDYQPALALLRQTYSDKQPKDFRIDWNSYVDGTIAFLEKDRKALVAARNRLRLQDPFPEKILESLPEELAAQFRGTKMNLPVLNGLLNCFDQPYSEAYGVPCRKKGTLAD